MNKAAEFISTNSSSSVPPPSTAERIRVRSTPLASSAQSASPSGSQAPATAVVLAFTLFSPSEIAPSLTALSGHLSSYTKNDPDESCKLYHELVVKELNYVEKHGQGQRSENHEKPQSDRGETGSEKYRERLHLWQVFFANPYDWWDNRKRKLNSRQPDFKHKHMDEALWLSPDDPPWVKAQIYRLDVRMAEQGHGEHVGRHRRISKWEYNE